MADALERSIWINASIERTWQAVTDAGLLTRWYATHYAWEIPALEVGRKIAFYNSETEPLGATITVLDPPREFTVRWEPMADYPDVVLVTSFLLAEENGGTYVTIRETGYDAVPADERQAWIDAAFQGYGGSVENLKALLEGQPLPHE